MRKEDPMDYLAPPLNAVLYIQLQLKNGISARSAIQSYTQSFPECPFARQVGIWLMCQESGHTYSDSSLADKNYRKILLDLFASGLKGESILPFLQELEHELKQLCQQILEEQSQKLPFITLIPLFLFQVPAFFLLLLGPLLLELQKSLSIN